MNHTAKLSADTRGSLLVETTLSFVMFVGVLVSIMSLINLVTLHDRIQYALTQVASELATYSYLYEATGIKASHDSWKNHAGSAVEDVQGVIDGIGTLAGTPGAIGAAGSLGEVSDAVDDAIDAGETIYEEVTHPKELVQKIITSGFDHVIEGGKSFLLEGVSWMFMPKYLAVDASAVAGGKVSADEYLRLFGVIDGIKGMDFSASTLFSDSETIDIIVQYDVNYKFALLPLPFTKIHMVQRVVTSGWCGDGEHYE